ncbi:MAG TPA: hypothetical protein PL007_03735 [Thermomonas sp.]|jgi:hypothetical protein|nr:hypothetical protein [Thermomonas sp.]HQY49458.1 hypothetical protein [Thermomonas sp.]HRA56233.1 hypothetical protein [Thermomonas sp.]
MTKLVVQQAPEPAIPQRFLLTASVWGVLAGGLLVCDGDAVLASRWAGASVAVVHAFTLGFLGNAMVGSLLQFLPVAVQAPVRGGRKAAAWLYGLLNAGALLLVLALHGPLRLSPMLGGGVLLAAFMLLLVLLLPGLWQAGTQRLLRWGIGSALLAALVTALLGFALAAGLSGKATLALPALTDLHASWGVLGWILGLLAAVSRVVAPMFQGALPAPARLQGVWQALLYGVLLLALLLGLAGGALPGMRIAVAGLGLAFALGGLLLQSRAAKLRNVPLTWFWRSGLLALAASAAVLAADAGQVVLVGALALALGLPWLVTGMQLEITGFLAWIDLQRRCGRGVRVPGVQSLVPERDKYMVLSLQLLAGLTLVMAIFRQIPVNSAGLVLLLAHAAGVATQCAARWRVRRFAAEFKAGK